MQHLGFFFSNFNFKYEPKYLNLSIDLSIYNKNTKKNPVYLVPEAKIEIFEDIPRLHVSSMMEFLDWDGFSSIPK